MANKILYKFVNPGMASDDDTPASLVAKKQTLAINRLGKSLSSMGGIVKDIESIELARIKNDKLRDKLERRRAQRERDQEAEDATEMRNLSKKDSKPTKGKIKNWLGKAGKTGKFLKDQLPLWAKMMTPIVEFIARLFTIAVIKEGLEWFADPKNQKKVETFLHKINVVFTQLGKFSNWLFKEKLQGGWEKLTGKEKNFGERMSGLWDLVQGVATIGMLTTPLGMLAAITGWIGNFIHNKPWARTTAGGRPKVTNNTTNRSRRTPTTSGGRSTGKLGGVREWWRKNNIFRTKPKVTVSQSNVKPSSTKGVTKWFKDLFKTKPKITGSGTTSSGGNAVTKFFKGIANSKTLKNVKSTLGNLKPKKVSLGSPIKMLIVSMGVGKLYDSMENNLEVKPEVKRISALSDEKKTEVVSNLVREIEKEQKWQKNPLYKGQQVWSILANLAGDLGNEPNASKKIRLNNKILNNLNQSGINVNDFTKLEPVKEVEKKKKWWNPFTWGKAGGGTIQEMFLGGIVKGISKAVSGVVKGVSNAVSGVVKGVSNIVSNPIVGTALSFIPGVGPIVGAINAVNSLRQGNILGAAMGAWGSLGNFAAIGSTAQSVVNTPNWMMNLRMSGFGRGLASMHSGLSGAFGNIASGWNNFMGTDLGKLGKGVFTGLSGGGWGGALQQFGSMTGMTAPGGLFGQGGFFGEGGRMAGMGDWLQKHNLAGIGNMFPGLSGLANSIPGLANLPGISDLFAGQFSPAQFIGGIAEKNGMGGLYKSAMGLLGGGDLYTGLKEIGGELGISPEVFGAVDKGKSLYERAKKHALNPDPVELLPILVPIIKDQVVMAPAVKEKAVVYLDAAQSMMNRV